MAVTNSATAVEAAALRRVSWRLLPFLLLAYLIFHTDRVNVGFAALQMNEAVGIDPKTYGLGAGIFFIGYFIFAVPNNLALQRFGARIWIPPIMIICGLASAAFALTDGPDSFLALRFLLGVVTSGFFPGILLYFTYWYPASYRATVIGIFMVAVPVGGLIGSPIRGALLYMDGVWGLAGWQWIFVLEAMPAIVLGVAAFGWLTDRPERATWLAPEQRRWLTDKLASENRNAPRIEHASVWITITNKYVLILALVYAGASGAGNSLALWMPQIVKSFGLTNWETGLLNAVPFGVAAMAMILWGRSSDASGERVWHCALSLGLIALAMVGTFFAIHSLWAMVPLLTLIAAGAYGNNGPFWALSSEWLGAASAAAGLAQINALANLSNFIFNYLIGWMHAETGSFSLALMPIALVAAVGTLSVLAIGSRQPRTTG